MPLPPHSPLPPLPFAAFVLMDGTTALAWYPPGKDGYKARAWCPPTHARYEKESPKRRDVRCAED